MRRVDLTGQRFGEWQVLGSAGSTPRGRALWLCQCRCGVVREVRGDNLRGGGSKYCGHDRKGSLRHGHDTTGAHVPTYMTWKDMKQRILNPRHKAYADYGGRGIDMDPRWDEFEIFLADMGERPPDPLGWTSRKSYYSIERIDNDKGYWPWNCKWATPTEQVANRRASREALDTEEGT